VGINSMPLCALHVCEVGANSCMLLLVHPDGGMLLV
jgi:hypothetical protein